MGFLRALPASQPIYAVNTPDQIGHFDINLSNWTAGNNLYWAAPSYLKIYPDGKWEIYSTRLQNNKRSPRLGNYGLVQNVYIEQSFYTASTSSGCTGEFLGKFQFPLAKVHYYKRVEPALNSGINAEYAAIASKATCTTGQRVWQPAALESYPTHPNP